jgi:hypothetical protein|tara:strand:- start:389 stop:859 length:471 start_codon:yes stop_codon:yes gene_type:complete
MATRNLTMVVNRRHARNTKKGLAISPYSVAEYSFVNMYLHHDGYPEWQAVQLANWVLANPSQDSARVAAKLVHDHYYDSCYLYADPDNIDHQYTYIIWTGDSDRTMIACHDRYTEQCVFVMTPKQILEKYTEDMDYTNFAAGETRLMKCEDPNFTS